MITLQLRCKCTDGEVEFQVREREDEEDIRDWMEHVVEKISEWHAARGCPETNLEYMKIPLADHGGAKVGQS